PLDKGVQHPLGAGLLEIDGKLVAVDLGDGAVAELDVEDALAGGEQAAAALVTGDQFTLDDPRLVPGCRAIGIGPAGALPAGGGIGAFERIHPVEPAFGEAETVAAIGAERLLDLDMLLRQLVDEARRQRRLPQVMQAPVLREADMHPLARPRQADIGEATFLLEPLA